MQDNKCAKCGSNDFVAIDSTGSNATVIVIVDGKDIVKENTGDTHAKITVCKECGHVMT